MRPRAHPRAATVLRVAGAVGGLVVAALLVSAFTPLPNALARRLLTPDPEAPADAIVALASTALLDGTLNPSSLERLVRALELHAAGLAPILVLSGALPYRGVDEARLRADLARRLGVPGAAIVTLSGQRTTRDEARSVAALLGPRGVRRVLLVTDWTHAARARATFRHVGLDARVAVTDRPAEGARKPEDRLALTWRCVRELAAHLYYRLAGYA